MSSVELYTQCMCEFVSFEINRFNDWTHRAWKKPYYWKPKLINSYLLPIKIRILHVGWGMIEFGWNVYRWFRDALYSWISSVSPKRKYIHICFIWFHMTTFNFWSILLTFRTSFKNAQYHSHCINASIFCYYSQNRYFSIFLMLSDTLCWLYLKNTHIWPNQISGNKKNWRCFVTLCLNIMIPKLRYSWCKQAKKRF